MKIIRMRILFQAILCHFLLLSIPLFSYAAEGMITLYVPAFECLNSLGTNVASVCPEIPVI